MYEKYDELDFEFDNGKITVFDIRIEYVDYYDRDFGVTHYADTEVMEITYDDILIEGEDGELRELTKDDEWRGMDSDICNAIESFFLSHH